MAHSPYDQLLTALNNWPDDANQQPNAVLVERMEELVQIRAMAEAALCEQLAVFDGRGGASDDGQASTRAWLGSMLRLGTDASHLLKVARELSKLPEAYKAFAAGEFTLEHAAALAWLIGKLGPEPVGEYVQVLLELARTAPPKQLRIACEHIYQLLDPDGDADEAAAKYRKRYLSADRTLDGMVHVRGLLDAAGGDVLLTALRAAMPAPAEYEERTPDQRRADALTDIAAGWLAAGEAPTSGGLPAQVQVTLSRRGLQEAVRRQADPGFGNAAAAVFRPLFGIADDEPPAGQLLGDVPVLAEGQPISIEQARRVACDAGIIPVVLGSKSEPLDIGRRSRVVPVGLRRALNLRDGGCRYPGCDRPASWADAHHIRHWVDGGPTSLDNMILLCGHHHHLVHEGWRLIGDPNDTIRFERPDGTRLGLTSAPRCRPPTWVP